MTALRVLLSAPPAANRAEAWARSDDGGRVVERGVDTPDRWPAASRREAVLAAGLVRVIALALPPMSPARLASAAAYALEDRLAATGAAAAIGVSAPRADGSVLAAVTAQATLDAVAAHAPRFARIVAEPALAPVSSGWTWCASGASGGFVRTADGGAFAVGAAPAGGVLPPELVAALAQAPRGGGAPASVVVTQPCTDALLAQWRASTGVAFERGEPWRWDDAPESAYAAAPDLLRAPEIAAPARGAALRLWKPAAAIALAAVALHVVATIAQWSWLRIDAWRSGERIVALAQGAGVADAATPDAALRALARRDAELRHRAGLAAASDAVPLLARAAPALAALPAAAVKSATFADGAWTFELATLDDAARAALDRRMQDNGLTALQARTAAGARMRVTPAP